MHVLFICTGNTCRSPMAEGFLRARAIRERRDDVLALSAGLFPAPGAPAANFAQLVMKNRNIDITSHRSRRLAAPHVEAADVIVTMTEPMTEVVKAMFPEAADKVTTLSRWSGGTGDVSDPYGGTMREYESCAVEIDEKIAAAWQLHIESSGED